MLNEKQKVILDRMLQQLAEIEERYNDADYMLQREMKYQLARTYGELDRAL